MKFDATVSAVKPLGVEGGLLSTIRRALRPRFSAATYVTAVPPEPVSERFVVGASANVYVPLLRTTDDTSNESHESFFGRPRAIDRMSRGALA
jgi:hypothetical protein